MALISVQAARCIMCPVWKGTGSQAQVISYKEEEQAVLYRGW